eukprot:GGOE01001068.1.p1 GENE.GGOE01001068.1~~GGOE01001068.1.p1  ORF type:complete len:597 (+),score=105.55 GGOE01001068.1:130-1920(+)
MPKRKQPRGPENSHTAAPAGWEDPDGWMGFGAMLAAAGLPETSTHDTPKKKRRKATSQGTPATKAPAARAISHGLRVAPDVSVDGAPAAAQVFGDSIVQTYVQPLAKCFSLLHEAVAEAFVVLRCCRASVALSLSKPWTACCMDRLAGVMAQVEALGRAHPAEAEEVSEVCRTFRLLPAATRDDEGRKGRAARVRQALRLDALYYDLYCMARKVFPQYRPEVRSREEHSTAHPSTEPSIPVPAPHEYFRALEELLFCHTTLPDKMRRLLASLEGPLTQPLLECWGVDPQRLQRPTAQPPWAAGANPLLTIFQHRLSEGLWLLEGVPTEVVSRWHQCTRDWAARIYAFAIPTTQALHCIGTDVVEIGAASGFWSHLLRAAGARVLPLDISPAAPHERWCEVRRGSTKTLARLTAARYPTLLLCFPSPPEGDGTSMADDALAAFRGQRVCYVGEWATGMTASLPFHRTLANDFRLETVVHLPNWSQIGADLRIFVRQSNSPSPSCVPQAVPLLTCTCCGGSGGSLRLFRCPLVRQPVVCSEACLAKVGGLYRALRTAGCWPPEEPQLAHWERVCWMDCKENPAAFARLAQLVPNETRN